MLLTFLFFVVALLLVLATLPLIAELSVLTLAALSPASTARNRNIAKELPSLAIVVPAHNEEALIGRCIRSLETAADEGVERIVVAHNCTDATAAEALAAGARVLVLNDPSQKGKGCALHYGFATALAGASQAVLVIDADSVVSPNLISEVRRRFSEGAQALQCRYEVYNAAATRSTQLTALAFQAFNLIRPRGRERLGLSVGIFGNGFALQRAVLKGIPYGAHSVVEDLEYHLSLVRAGMRVEFLDTATVRGEMPVSKKGTSTQRARWEGGRLLMMKQWAPRLLAEVLRGRLRLIEPLFDLLGLPLAMEVLLLLLTALMTAVVPGAWLKLYVLIGFGVIVMHLFAAAASGPNFWESIKVLVTAPAYVVWKLRMLPAIWRTSRTNATWVRTERSTSPNSHSG